ncbi:MAG: hypothetical protein V7765_18710 [Oleispira sp.]
MKVSYKAALMSGFVFPGAGYMTLKMPKRAAVTIIAASVCLYGLIQITMMKTYALMDRLIAGDVAPDMVSMLKALQDTSAMSMGWQDYAGYGFMICWGLSVFDAIRLAKKV